MKTKKAFVNKTHIATISVVLVTMIILMAGILAAQDGGYRGPNFNRAHRPPYDPKIQPPLEMITAYQMAMTYLGTATNRLYCVGASCLKPTRQGVPGWTFSFSSTNGYSADVDISFDKELYTDGRTRQMLGK